MAHLKSTPLRCMGYLQALKEKENEMKRYIVSAELYIMWSDGLKEEISEDLPDYLREALEVYLDELQEESNDD